MTRLLETQNQTFSMFINIHVRIGQILIFDMINTHYEIPISSKFSKAFQKF